MPHATAARPHTRIAALLVATLALSAVAVPAAAATCGPDGPAILGPDSIYIVAGQPISEHQYSTDCDEPTTWTLGGAVPAGITFDSTKRMFTGTPTELDGSFEITATNIHGETLLEGSFEPLDTATTLTGPDSLPLGPATLAPGDPIEVHGQEVPTATRLDVRWDATTLDSKLGDGAFQIDLAVPTTATRGAHQITTVFTLPNGQQYSDSHNVNVTVLEVQGPAQLNTIVGVDQSYSYTGIDAGPDATYELTGELPPGLAFDAGTATISGAPDASTEHPKAVTIRVTDGPRTASLDVSVTATAPESLALPVISTPAQRSLTLDELMKLLDGLGDTSDLSDEAIQQKIQRMLDDIANDAKEKKPSIPIGPDPETGGTTIIIGTPTQADIEQARRLLEQAKRAAAEAKRKELEAQQKQRQAELEAERLKKQQQIADEREKRRLEAEERLQRLLAEAERKRAELLAAQKERREQAEKAAKERLDRLASQKERGPLPEGTTVNLELNSTPMHLGSATVGASGSFLLLASIPRGAAVGDHHLVVTYTFPDGSVHTQAMAVTVYDPGVLPATGAPDVTPWGYAAAVLLLLGAVLMVQGRRGRSGFTS